MALQREAQRMEAKIAEQRLQADIVSQKFKDCVCTVSVTAMCAMCGPIGFLEESGEGVIYRALH